MGVLFFWPENISFSSFCVLTFGSQCPTQETFVSDFVSNPTSYNPGVWTSFVPGLVLTRLPLQFRCYVQVGSRWVVSPEIPHIPGIQLGDIRLYRPRHTGTTPTNQWPKRLYRQSRRLGVSSTFEDDREDRRPHRGVDGMVTVRHP